jgi:hypothetical protein
MAGDLQGSSEPKNETKSQASGEGLEHMSFNDDKRHRSLLCIAVGIDPAGRQHRIRVRLAGTSFVMIDNRRKCRVEPRRSCQVTEEDMTKEIAFAFRVNVSSFEYLWSWGMQQNQLRLRKGVKSEYWNKWERHAAYTDNDNSQGDAKRPAWPAANKQRAGKMGGKASASRSVAARSEAAKLGAITRKRNALKQILAGRDCGPDASGTPDFPPSNRRDERAGRS